MIVRISGEGQFDIADSEVDRLNELERAVIAAVDSCSEADYAPAFGALIDHVRNAGRPVAEDELGPSDVILPPSDTSLTEAAADFTGEGLIPD
jgi:hypothetical protein